MVQTACKYCKFIFKEDNKMSDENQNPEEVGTVNGADLAQAEVEQSQVAEHDQGSEELVAVSPSDFKDAYIGFKGKDLVAAVNWNQLVYPSDDEYASQMITSTPIRVNVKDSKPVAQMVGKKGEKRPKLDENNQQIYVNKSYAKPVGLYILEQTIRDYLEEHGIEFMVGKLIGPIVAAGRNKNIKNPVPDNYNFSLAHVEAFYDGQTIEEVWKSLLGQGWAPPTSRLSTAAAIAAACPVEFDEEVVDKYFAYVASQFDGAKKADFGIGDAATFRSLTTFIGKKCQTPRLPKSSYLSTGLTIINQLSSKANSDLKQITSLIENNQIPEDKLEDAKMLQEAFSEKPRIYNHVLCALTEAHKQAIRKEAIAASKRKATDKVAKDDDLLTAFLEGEDIHDQLGKLTDLIPNDMEI